MEHDKTARARKKINTASYAQVTEKIYTGALYRWQRYRAEMAPALEILRPWAEKYGY
jgi:hypothetical protein